MIQYQTKNSSGKRNSKQFIILHHTGTWEGTAQGCINGCINWKASFHYLVDENGQIYKFNTDDDVLWHAGVSERKTFKGMNNYSIGIEVIGPLSGPDQFTDAQRKSVTYLIKKLATDYKIPKENILRHKDIAPGRKVDIYDTFWSTTHTTRSAYIQKILGQGDKPETVKKIMDLNSKRWNETQDGEERAVLESVNSYYRNKFK